MLRQEGCKQGLWAVFHALDHLQLSRQTQRELPRAVAAGAAAELGPGEEWFREKPAGTWERGGCGWGLAGLPRGECKPRKAQPTQKPEH